jgi:epoxide hydrolase-like predicted phosphatase
MVIKAIFFDIGGILVKEDRVNQYAKLAKVMEIDLDEFIAIKKAKAPLFTEGKISEKRYFQFYIDAFNLDAKKFKSNWLKLAKKHNTIDKSIEKLLFQLKKNYLLGTLTNVNSYYNKLREQNDAYKHFKIKLLSFKEKRRKPDTILYTKILKITKLNPNEIIFIDDKIQYIEPAQKIGMNTILFKNKSSLIRDLKKLGVIL